MGLSFVANGSLLLTASQQDLFTEITSDALHACLVHLDAMEDAGSGDIIEIRVFVHDQQDDTQRQFQLSTFTDSQSSPSILFDFIPTHKYLVTAVQTQDGTAGKKTISWERMEIT